MIPTLGYLTLALGFLLALYGFLTMTWGVITKSSPWMETARSAMLLIFPLVSVSMVVMLILLGTHRFDVAYVYSVTNRNMPLYLRLTALWGGQSGSLLFWNWLLAGFSMVFALREHKKTRNIFPWACLVLFALIGFFLAMTLFIDNPFERFWYLADGSWVVATFMPASGSALFPQDGQGLNPLLRHPGMILHPPALYLGFVGFAVPFALAIGSLAAGRQDPLWLRVARPWLLFAWVFLSMGLVLGMRWAYDVLGWGGYWGWDPVEISALLPWLSATALLHTSQLQKKRDGYSRWNLILIILTFSLVIFSVFSTRSGALVSVHSFAESEIGSYLFVLLAVVFWGALALLAIHWRALKGTYNTEFRFSRETLTLFTNLVLLSILGVCLLGVLTPSISGLITGTQVTVGPAWYERITAPLFILLVFLMGICPLAAWGSTVFKKLPSRLWITLLLSFIPALIAWYFGVKQASILMALWCAGLAGWVIFAEYSQNVWVALKQAPRRFLRALWLPLWTQSRRYGGLIVHLGIVLMSIGIIGIEGLQQETQVRLGLGEETTLGSYRFSFENYQDYNLDDHLNVTEAELVVSRNDKFIGVLRPQRQIYLDMLQAYTQPGLHSTLAVDLYAVLIEGSESADEATFKFFVTPLVKWLWIGSGVLTFGTIIAALPSRKDKPEDEDLYP